MADEILRSRHAFGTVENLQYAVDNKLVDEHDVLFLKDKDGKASIGWIDKNGEVVMVTDEKADLSKVESDIDALESNVEILETEMSKKADAETVNAELDELNSGIAELVVDMDACEKSHEKIKYEIADVPLGTLVKYLSNEIRIMCPVDAEFTKQSVGAGGDSNNYYMTFKTYAPDNAVGYIEHLGDQVDKEILNDLKTDKYGRKYQPSWLAVAKYDEASDTWSYYGAKSTDEKYIGWNYQIDWYNADGVMIASDSIRINLSNEECHSSIEPYYIKNMHADIDEKLEAVSEGAKTYTDEQIAEIMEAMAVVEF